MAFLSMSPPSAKASTSSSRPSTADQRRTGSRSRAKWSCMKDQRSGRRSKLMQYDPRKLFQGKEPWSSSHRPGGAADVGHAVGNAPAAAAVYPEDALVLDGREVNILPELASGSPPRPAATMTRRRLPRTTPRARAAVAAPAVAAVATAATLQPSAMADCEEPREAAAAATEDRQRAPAPDCEAEADSAADSNLGGKARPLPGAQPTVIGGVL
mmetsp:Transcript_24664/g.70192  ORF Transcript_24664/g.70192 Transcript_24664/m.70192 type:complete len:213 (-) Transcript_24664:44-682(-)